MTELLERPAKVGAAIFGIRVKSSSVVKAAQRQYQFHEAQKSGEIKTCHLRTLMDAEVCITELEQQLKNDKNASKACLDIYMEYNASVVDLLPESIKKAWKTGQLTHELNNEQQGVAS